MYPTINGLMSSREAYKYRIVLTDDAISKINPYRSISERINLKLKDTLNLLKDIEVISKVEYPTDWVNNIVIVEKLSGNLRISYTH